MTLPPGGALLEIAARLSSPKPIVPCPWKRHRRERRLAELTVRGARDFGDKVEYLPAGSATRDTGFVSSMYGFSLSMAAGHRDREPSDQPARQAMSDLACE